MSVRFWKQLSAVRHLSPASIRTESEQPFSLALVAQPDDLRAWEQALVPTGLSCRKRDQALKRFFAVPIPLTRAYREMLAGFRVLLATPAAADEIRDFARNYTLVPSIPDEDRRWAGTLTDELWERHAGLRFALARHYVALCPPVVSRVIGAVAYENAAFAILSALPNVIPSPFELPWVIGEFASDTAFITANQFRMAFMIAAASDAPVGWREQKGQLASIVGAAFGWRALARELAGKLPAGTGLVAKGLIAYSGTHAVGRGLEQFQRFGRHFTRAERQQAYDEAFHTGRVLVEELAGRLVGRTARSIGEV